MASEEQFKRISTGVAGLDTMLKGGYPQGSFILICGSPGTGKTVLALQTLFANTKEQGKVIYFNSIAETPQKLLMYHQGFKFFDRAKLDRLVLLRDVAQIVRDGDLTRLLTRIVGEIQETEAHLVAIDHFREVAEMVRDKTTFRLFLSELSQQIGILNCAALILADYSGTEMLAAPEASLTDGVIQLGLYSHEVAAHRTLQVTKMRGTDFPMETHPFSISDNGITLWTGVEKRRQPRRRLRDFLFRLRLSH